MSSSSSNTSQRSHQEDSAGKQWQHPAKREEADSQKDSSNDKQNASSSDSDATSGSDVARRTMMKQTAAAGTVFGLGLNADWDSSGEQFIPTGGWDPIPPSPSLDELPDNRLDNRPGNFDEPGYPSRETYQELAQAEREAYEQVGEFTATEVNAVDFLGVGGGTPVNEALDQAGGSIEGKMLFFPEGEYRVTDHVWVNAEMAGIRAPDATFVLEPDVKMTWYLYATNGLYEGFTIDQSAKGAKSTEKIVTPGRGIMRDVEKVGSVAQEEMVGTSSSAQIMCLPTPKNGGLVRVENYKAMGGSNAGSHSWATSRCSPPPGFVASDVGCPGVGTFDGSEGTVFLINIALRGWENGCYTSKTEGTAIRIMGGVFINNNNASLRLAGNDSKADGATVVLDQRQYDVSKMPGPYKPGGIQGVNPVRCEGKGNPHSAQLVNLDLQAYKVEKNGVSCSGGMNGLIRIQGTVGSGPIHNCRLESHVPNTPAIKVETPDGSGNRQGPPPGAPTKIDMNHLDFYGVQKDAPEVLVQGRQNSRIQNSCIHVSGASPDDIKGVPSGNMQNIGYGSNCSSDQGNDGPVGSDANVSNISNYSGNYSGNFTMPGERRSESDDDSLGIIEQVTSTFTSIVVGLLMIVLLIASIIGGLGLVVAVGVYKFMK